MKTKKRVIIPLLAILFLLTPALVNTLLHERWKSQPGEGTFVMAGERKIYTVSAGKGPLTVIIESDSGSTSDEWKALRNILAPYCRVISYDRAGYGRSDSSLPKNPASVTADLELVLKAYDVDTFYAIGHGQGSLILEYYAARNPQRVLGLILCEVLSADYDRMKKEIDAVYYSNLYDRVPGIKIGKLIAALGYVRLWNAVPYEHVSRENRHDIMENFSSPSMYDSYLAELRTLRKELAREVSANESTAVPALVLHHNSARYQEQLRSYTIPWNLAEDFENVLLSMSQNTAARYRNGKVLFSKTASQNLHIEDPSFIAAALLQLIGTE